MTGTLTLRSRHCEDCGEHTLLHASHWFDDLLLRVMPPRLLRRIPTWVDRALVRVLEFALIKTRAASYEGRFARTDVPLRSHYFAEAARKAGIRIECLKGPFGYTDHFRMQLPNGTMHFEGLPILDPELRHRNEIVDDKGRTKKALAEGFFPHAEGRAFWAWQRERALRYGETLGFPLVVKPRTGSVARHVTTKIEDVQALRAAIDHAVRYAPSFVIERYMEGFVHRATVVNYDRLFIVRQLPAHVVGNGEHTVAELVEIKNASRAPKDDQHALYHKLHVDDATEVLLAEQGYQLHKVPPANATVILSRDPFMRLGGDLEDVTERAHPENLTLFRELARYFETPVVGIDFITYDIGASWKEEGGAVLELNSLPSIELHHEPTYGESRDVAGEILRMALKKARA